MEHWLGTVKPREAKRATLWASPLIGALLSLVLANVLAYTWGFVVVAFVLITGYGLTLFTLRYFHETRRRHRVDVPQLDTEDSAIGDVLPSGRELLVHAVLIFGCLALLLNATFADVLEMIT